MKVGISNRRPALRTAATGMYAAKYDVFTFAYNRNGEPSTVHRYEKTTGGDRLPEWLRLDPVRDTTKYRNITHFLSSQQIGRSKAVNTGLQPVGAAGSYAGDVLTDAGKSLLAVQFNEDRTTLTVYVFWNFWKERTAHRLAFVRNFLSVRQSENQ